MKRFIKPSVLAITFLMLVMLSACSGNNSDNSTNSSTEESASPVSIPASSQPASDPTPSEKTFTREELKKYDGQNGNRAYVAVNGVVYDVTDYPKWAGGMHNGNAAGQDLTEEIKRSPHGEDKLKGVKVVGKLVE